MPETWPSAALQCAVPAVMGHRGSHHDWQISLAVVQKRLRAVPYVLVNPLHAATLRRPLRRRETIALPADIAARKVALSTFGWRPIRSSSRLPKRAAGATVARNILTARRPARH